jgi:hypothetical protein
MQQIERWCGSCPVIKEVFSRVREHHTVINTDLEIE